MKKNIRTWVVAADAARAQLFIHRDQNEVLTPADLPNLPPPEDRVQSHTEKSDRSGRSHSPSADGMRYAVESHSDYRKLEKHKFTVAVANALNRAALAKEFDQLILIAPARSVGEFRKCLSDQAQSGMRIIAKDLTRAPGEQIWGEVAAMLRHPHWHSDHARRI